MADMGGGKSAFDFEFEALKGGSLPLGDFAGRPMVVVNTASKCGFTPQYEGLEALWQRHRDQGLIVLGVPSNDFGGQEPGSSDEIASFCQINYGVDFPLTGKVHVRGAEAHPLFRWLASKGGFLSKPRWNFYKYLIGRDGQLQTWFSSLTPPGSAKFGNAVERLMRD
ncbi:MAG TPA: glutathione peroxidase [Aliidongia sp.]|nr:glutathione peroxidase [Aliidongia sp.]